MQKIRKKVKCMHTPASQQVDGGKKSQEDNKKKRKTKFFFSRFRLFKIKRWPVGIALVFFPQNK